jgi:carbon catabolite-derepressing protein kinase
VPPYLSQEARTLIARMLAVDPVKRITIPEIMQTDFFKADLPRYLAPLPPPPGPVLGSLMSLVSPSKVFDYEYIEGLGRIEEDIVQSLADRMADVNVEDVWDALRVDDGPQGNAVKVAYMLLRDKRRSGPACMYFIPWLNVQRRLTAHQWLCSKRKNERRNWPLWTFVLMA